MEMWLLLIIQKLHYQKLKLEKIHIMNVYTGVNVNHILIVIGNDCDSSTFIYRMAMGTH